MENIGQDSNDSLSLSKVVRIDQICDRFDHAIHTAIQNRGPWPSSEDYLGDTTEPVRSELRQQLLAVEVSYRQQQAADGDPAGVASTAEIVRPPVRDPGGSPTVERASTVAQPATTTTAPDVYPDHIGRYRVEMVLGCGAFGRVYRCYDDLLKRSVAVKVPHHHLLDRPELYLEEARVLARLEHPAIVPVYNVEHDEEGRPYAVMEFVEGQSLKESLEAALPSPARAAELIATIAEAIDHAHRHGFVHRDLKPANILLDTAGTPHVLDFGLAIDELSQRDRPGEMAGTMAYMAPEQVRCESHRLDGRADIWAL
ncbi:MAG: serine/threonine-protein kinase, partial [Thermoguttaceae bacterium]